MSAISVQATADEVRPAARIPPPHTEDTVPDGDNWPRTSRLMPWHLAIFMAMVFLVPFDSAALKVSLPFDLKLDRIALLGMAGAWLAALAAGGPAAPRLRRSPVNVALGLFLGVAVTSVALNLEVLANVGELDLALRQLVLLVTLVAFFFIAASIVRPGEVASFSLLLVGLAVVTAIGTIWEYRTGTNQFFELLEKVPGLTTDIRESSVYFDSTGRRNITGPTNHGLAVTTMLALTLPIAVVGILRARGQWQRIGYAIAVALILTGGIASVRKTAAIVPVVAIAALVVYRPRPMARLVPLGLVLVMTTHLLVPGAMGSIKSQLFPKGQSFFSQASVEGREQDYDAVKPDVFNHLAFGRGYGTYYPLRYRLLDNQYLGLRIEVGYVGLAAFVLIMLAVLYAAHPLILSRHPARAPPALAAAAGAVTLGVASLLFDSLAFPQVSYVFLFAAALVTVAALKVDERVAAPSDAALAPPPSAPQPHALERPARASAGVVSEPLAPERVPRAPKPVPRAPEPSRGGLDLGAPVPTARRRSAAGPRRRVWLVSALAAPIVAGVAGFMLGEPGQDPRRVSAGDLALTVPGEWERRPGPAPIRLSEALVLGPPGEPDRGLVIGRSRATDATLLPEPLRAASSLRRAAEVVRIRDIEGYRYPALELRRPKARLALYSMPYSGGVATIGCFAAGDPDGDFARECEQAADTLAFRAGHPTSVGVRSAYRAMVDEAVATLGAGRAALRARLRKARSPRGQARAATRLSRAHESAANRLAKAPANDVERFTSRSLVRTLRGSADAYGRLATASRRHRRAAFRRASAAIDRHDAALERELRNLARAPRGWR